VRIVEYFFQQRSAIEREAEGNDCPGDGYPQVAEDDAKRAGAEHTEGHGSRTGETIGDAEIEAFRTRQESCSSAVGEAGNEVSGHV
jgi:hypothetical protein